MQGKNEKLPWQHGLSSDEWAYNIALVEAQEGNTSTTVKFLRHMRDLAVIVYSDSSLLKSIEGMPHAERGACLTTAADTRAWLSYIEDAIGEKADIPESRFWRNGWTEDAWLDKRELFLESQNNTTLETVLLFKQMQTLASMLYNSTWYIKDVAKEITPATKDACRDTIGAMKKWLKNVETAIREHDGMDDFKKL